MKPLKLEDISIDSIFYDDMHECNWKVIEFIKCKEYINNCHNNCKIKKRIHFIRMDNGYEVNSCPYNIGFENLCKLEDFIKEEEFSV